MRSTYDEVLYPGLPYSQTHPDRLATLGALFGLEPAPVGRCRVLELACGSGDNLIPMAFEAPGAQFVGIDLAETAVQAGREEIAALGLANIRLEHMNIMDAGSDLGVFDYIIAHGFYAWAPAPVRDKLLAVIGASLAPQGVAYVSYNALPGGRIREMFREMMLFHVKGVADHQTRIEGARQLLQWFTESYCGPGISKGFLKDEAQSMLDRLPHFLYHDELSEAFQPVYFREFISHAARFGLQYLSEANYFDTQPGKIPEAIVAKVNLIAAGDRIVREQYFDLLKCRMFRQTLLCHADAPLAAAPVPERVFRLWASSPARPVSAPPDFRPGVVEEFVGTRASSAKTAHPLPKAALFVLTEAWPETVAFPDLLASVERLTGEPQGPESLAEILLATYAAGLIELHAHPLRCVSKISRCPVASSLARSQAQRGKLITTPLHSTVECGDEVERRLIALMDGTRDLPALAREIGPISGRPEEVVAGAIQANIAALARTGLLVG